MRDISWWIFKIFIFIVMLTSFRAWMFWNIQASIFFWIGAFFVSIILMFVNAHHFAQTRKRRQICVIWFLILQFSVLITFVGSNSNLNGILSMLIPTWTVFSIIMLNDDSKKDLINTCIIMLSFILLISLVAWFLWMIGVPFSYDMVPYGENDLYYFENYRFFLRNTTMVGDLLFPRFCSIFLEPGFLGCLISLILFIRRYKMDFCGIILGVSELVTVSLAGWILVGLGMLFYFGLRSKKSILVLLSTISIFFVLWGAARSINNGDNWINHGFFERLEYDKDTGTIAGYDRSTASTDEWFWNTFIKSTDVFFGSPSADAYLAVNDNDWKAYIVRNGIVGLSFFMLFAFFPFFSSLSQYKNIRKMEFVLSTLFFLIFAQTIHLIFSVMYLAVLILGESVIRTDNSLVKLKNAP